MADTAQSVGIKRHDHSADPAEQLVSQPETGSHDATEILSTTVTIFLRPHVTSRPFTWVLSR